MWTSYQNIPCCKNRPATNPRFGLRSLASASGKPATRPSGVSRPAAVESLRRASFPFTSFDPTYREGGFVTEVLECDTRMAGDVEKAVLKMYLSTYPGSRLRPWPGSPRRWAG